MSVTNQAVVHPKHLKNAFGILATMDYCYFYTYT